MNYIAVTIVFLLPATLQDTCKVSSWEKVGYHRVRFYKTGKSWLAGIEYCRSQGGDLLSVHSASAASAYTDRAMSGIRMRIGLRSYENEGFKWSDGTPLNFSYWKSAADSKKKDVCVVALTSERGKWAIESCLKERYFMCKSRAPCTPRPLLMFKGERYENKDIILDMVNLYQIDCIIGGYETGVKLMSFTCGSDGLHVGTGSKFVKRRWLLDWNMNRQKCTCRAERTDRVTFSSMSNIYLKGIELADPDDVNRQVYVREGAIFHTTFMVYSNTDPRPTRLIRNQSEYTPGKDFGSAVNSDKWPNTLTITLKDLASNNMSGNYLLVIENAKADQLTVNFTINVLQEMKTHVKSDDASPGSPMWHIPVLLLLFIILVSPCIIGLVLFRPAEQQDGNASTTNPRKTSTESEQGSKHSQKTPTEDPPVDQTEGGQDGKQDADETHDGEGANTSRGSFDQRGSRV